MFLSDEFVLSTVIDGIINVPFA